jgi:hypothetical protein
MACLQIYGDHKKETYDGFLIFYFIKPAYEWLLLIKPNEICSIWTR